MKTVCKKLLCLMLVAMMLVSAVPFAFAEETPCTKHSWDEGVVAEPATCIAEGAKVLTCTVCGEKTRQTIPMGKCSWDEGVPGVEPTCTTDGDKVLTCTVCGEKTRQTVYSTGTEHNFEPGAVTAATCTEGGYTTYECTNDGCDATDRRDQTNALNHDWSDWSVTKAATTEAKGEETRTCKRCSEPETRDIPKLTPPANDPAPTTYTLEFYYLDEEGAKIGVEVEVENNDVIPFPSVPDVERKDFLHWVDGTNAQITVGTRWNVGESQKFTAVYKNDTTADDLVTLDVRVAYYVDKEWHHEAKLYTKSFEKSSKNTMFEWLYSDLGKQQARTALEAKGYFGYDWDQVKYYDYFDKGEITKADLKADGDKTVFIKVYSTDEIEANVMLYVHTKKTADVDRVIPMPGYTAGDFVTYADVKAAVKTKYSGSDMTISDLYTETQWEDLLDDIKSSGSRSIEIEDNGTTEIHVIVKNATSGSNADSSNPKTGDYITVAATTMVLAAAALVSVLELKKRKMI